MCGTCTPLGQQLATLKSTKVKKKKKNITRKYNELKSNKHKTNKQTNKQ